MKWEPRRTLSTAPYQAPSMLAAIGRGLRNRCPVCGEGRVFDGYLKIVGKCSNCGAPLGRLRADDAPPYFTILLVGHLLVPGVLSVEKSYQPPMWVHMVVWLPVFTILCMVVLRPVKGAVVGWMTRLGFGDEDDPTAPESKPEPGPAVAARPEA